MTLAPFDELDVIREKLNEQRLKWNPEAAPSKKLVEDAIDDLLLLFILAYVCGKDHACEDLDAEVEIDEGQMQAAVYQEIKGETWVDRVTEHMKSFDVEAVMMVAETEVNRDFNQGAMNSAALIEKKTGRTAMKTWNTMLDEKVRDSHYPLEGTKIRLPELFCTFDYAGNADYADQPGHFSTPENNVNCRCYLTFSFD